MSRREKNEMMRDEGTHAVKKARKHNLFSLIICLLVAFVIWLYASSVENNDSEEQTNVASKPDRAGITQSVFEL